MFQILKLNFIKRKIIVRLSIFFKEKKNYFLKRTKELYFMIIKII
jgi:hypothetical protein